MKGVVFYGERRLEVVDFPDPSPRAGQVVVAVEASGMCGSDLHIYRGERRESPTIGGHEPAGVVVAVGAQVPASLVGQRVMVHHYIGCERCDQCRTGWTQLCRSGLVAMGNQVHGSHAEFVTVPLSTVVQMPDELSFLGAAAIGCGSGTAWGALHRMQLRGDDVIAIFGQGPVGLAATQFATAMGARVIALDISPERLVRSVSFGAWATLDPRQVDSVPDQLRKLTGGRGVSKSLETSGAASAAADAIASLDVWGTACFVGVGSKVSFDVSAMLPSQATLMTSWTMSVPSMQSCAQFVVDRGLDIDGLFTDVWQLSEAAAAYHVLDQQTSGKGVFVTRQAPSRP